MVQINVKTKKQVEEETRKYRNKGYMIITFFAGDFVELEKENHIVVIERKRRG